MSEVNKIEQRIAAKAEKQARTDIQNYLHTVQNLRLSGLFHFEAKNDSTPEPTVKERRICDVFEYYFKQNATNYAEILQKLTDEYIEQYTDDLISRMDVIREFLEVQS